MPDPPWAGHNAGPTQALLSPGQQPRKMVPVFFSTDKRHRREQPVLFSKSLTQGMAPTVAAHGTGK